MVTNKKKIKTLQKIINSNLTALVITILISFTALFSKHLNFLLIIFIVAVIISYFLLLLLEQLKRKRVKKYMQYNLIYERIENDYSVSKEYI